MLITRWTEVQVISNLPTDQRQSLAKKTSVHKVAADVTVSRIAASVQSSGSHLSRVHADGHLTIQVALGDHVGAAGVHHPWRLQGLHKVPADGLVAVPSGHLLEIHEGNQVNKLN